MVNEVIGTVEGGTRTFETKAPVYQNEVIATGAAGGTELQFLDGSTLTMGENSLVELTYLVFDPNPALSTMVMSMTTGAFSFATGELDSGAYIIYTSSATIGVRGTVFAIAIVNGVTTLTVTSGTVIITGTAIGALPVAVAAGQMVAVLAVGIAGPIGATTAATSASAAGGLGTGGVIGAGVAVAAAVGVAVQAVLSEDEVVTTTTQ